MEGKKLLNSNITSTGVLLACVKFFLFITLTGCAMSKQHFNDYPRSDSKSMHETNIITVQVKLISYKENAAFDDFFDGTVVSYDVSTFLILEPQKYSGKNMSVQHDISPIKNSLWTTVGKSLSFKIKEDLVANDSVVVNAGMVSDLKEINQK